MKNIFSKRSRVGTLQLVYIIFEYFSILLFSVILLFGFFKFISSIFAFFFNDHKFDYEAFTTNILSAFELFFLSPIPLLIIASFKGVIIKMYPNNVKVHPTIASDMIKEMDAKKTFISSLIGVTSTFILGQFIESLTASGDKNGNSITSSFNATRDYFVLIVLAIVFLVILIVLYYILTSHREEKEPPKN